MFVVEMANKLIRVIRKKKGKKNVVRNRKKNIWLVEDQIQQPSDVGLIMLAGNAAGKAKREEYCRISDVIRLFGSTGATLPEICGWSTNFF